MYQEVALDPRCLGEYHYYGLLRNGFGFEAGRYVIAPVRDWAKEAFQAAKKQKREEKKNKGGQGKKKWPPKPGDNDPRRQKIDGTWYYFHLVIH